MTPTRGWARLLRVGALGASSMLLAGSAHVAGGGALPSLGILAVLSLLVGLTAVTLTAWRCRLPLLLGVLGVEQLALHYVFTTAAAAGSTCGPMPAGHHGAPVCWSGSAEMVAMSSPGWLMWLAHVVAVGGTAWLLARGEAWLWRVTDQIIDATTAKPSPWPSAGRPAPAARRPLPALLNLAYAPAAPRGPPAA